ncbi:hypothetical protein GCM10010273_54360 [Streptomyces lavendulocolor]
MLDVPARLLAPGGGHPELNRADYLTCGEPALDRPGPALHRRRPRPDDTSGRYVERPLVS